MAAAEPEQGGPWALLDRAVEALRGEHHGEALLALDAALTADALPPAARARALGMRAQALLGAGQLDLARETLVMALRAARALGDAEGVTQLRGLNQTIYAALAHREEQARLAAEEAARLQETLESLLEAAQSPEERVMALIRKANQAADHGAPDLPLARRAVAEADTLPQGIREQVLARLCLARSCPEEALAWLEDARDRADDADEPNLVGAVASAARAMGLRFAERVF
ncbi:hypothetical protein L6R49_04660 [Myxococcota bacterium]|nr:hypothetical protein [Myxococcota bacterium]